MDMSSVRVSNRISVLRMMKTLLTLLLVSARCAEQGTCLSVAQRIDPNTKIAFPVKSSFEEGELVLAGVGSRVKAYIVTVYSVGLYADGAELSRGAAAKALLNGGGRLGVVLTFYMSVGAKKVADALAAVSGVDDQVIQDFQAMLVSAMNGNMNKGESMTLEWTSKRDSIIVTVRGKKISEIKDASLAKGLLDMYLGKQAVSPSLLKDIDSFAPEVVKSLGDPSASC